MVASFPPAHFGSAWVTVSSSTRRIGDVSLPLAFPSPFFFFFRVHPSLCCTVGFVDPCFRLGGCFVHETRVLSAMVRARPFVPFVDGRGDVHVSDSVSESSSLSLGGKSGIRFPSLTKVPSTSSGSDPTSLSTRPVSKNVRCTWTTSAPS